MLLRELYWFSKSSSLFNLPFFRKLRNKIISKYLNINGVKAGERVFIRASHQMECSSFFAKDGLVIGSDCSIDFTGGLIIGRNVTFSEGVKIFTHDHQLSGHEDWRKNEIIPSSLEISDYVWLGSNSIVLNSVKFIGKGAVIAAGAVVTKNVPPGVIVAGCPAKIISERNISCYD
ncbi:TPA: acyltransferase [Vibrio parahaemolyticus]|nr:acyltransferase [Vibrio parahaemolyticus]